MENARAGIRAFSALSPRRKAVVLITAALVLALLVGLCISIGIRSNMQRQYTAARNQAGQALYDNLFILMQSFDSTAVPNIDVSEASSNYLEGGQAPSTRSFGATLRLVF